MASRNLLTTAAVLVGLVACGHDVPRFPLRDPMVRDPDLVPAAYPCRPDPEKPGATVCTPEGYESFVYWDLVDKSALRPMAQFFAVSPGGEAVNVNSLDEVPDSSWFENRAGVRELTYEEKHAGFCAGQPVLPTEAEPGAWVIDQGKSDGVTPGFRIDAGSRGKFVLKADRLLTPYRASAAEVVGARLYYAAGFHVPCTFVASVDPTFLRVKPGLRARNESGKLEPFDERSLAKVFAQASQNPDGRYRLGASRWLPGRPLGPFTYDGVRDDDPLDVVPHEDRRELRAARLLAAWIGHYDAREQNTMATWMAANPAAPASSPGFVKHWYLDFGDSLGTRTRIDDLSRRYGHTYLFDPGAIGADLFTFGLLVRPWERVQIESPTFPYFTVAEFDAEGWVPGYPNPAFVRMTEHDGAWMARILARIDDDTVKAAVDEAALPPEDAAYLLRTLVGRRDAIVRRYLAKLSPIGNLVTDGDELCGIDHAFHSGLFPLGAFAHAAHWAEDEREPTARLDLRLDPLTGRLCTTLPRGMDGRRLRVRLVNGQARGPLDVFLVGAGPRHFRLLGARRPAP